MIIEEGCDQGLGFVYIALVLPGCVRGVHLLDDMSVCIMFPLVMLSSLPSWSNPLGCGFPEWEPIGLIFCAARRG